MKEEWRDIKNYEGYYQVSNLGRVRSLDREVEVHLSDGTTYFRKSKGRILKLGNNTNTGYLSVGFSVNGHQKTRDVHRLVAETFLPKENGKDYVDHINFNKHDNRVKNLRWVTQLENVSHSINEGRVDLEEKRKILNDPKVREKNLNAIRHPVQRSDGKIYESVTAAAKDTGCDRRGITLVLSGQNKTCKGYTFKYIPK